MEAKKLTMAVSFMMVLAAALVLVVPSESDAAEEFKITEAYFTGTSTISVKVMFNEAVPEGTFYISYGEDEEPLKVLEIAPGSTYIKTKLGTEIQEGTYNVYITTPNGNDSTTITYPTPVAHTVSVLATPAEGGTITADKEVAFAEDEVTITVTHNDEYKLTKVTLNGQPLAVVDDKAHFVMPDNDVMVVAMFEPAIVYCDVTFVIAEGFSNKVTATVGEPMQAPEDPEVIGAEFEGWYTEDGVKFDFETEIEGDMTLYAHFGPEAPSTEQTKKFVASIAVDGGVCNLVTTAYDGKIIGKGTAAIGVYMMYGGNFVYIDTVKYAIDGKDVFSVDNITKEIKTIATEPGQYAVMSTVMLDSGASYITNFALYEIEAQA